MRIPPHSVERAFSRRDFLRAGLSVGVAAGGGLLLGVSFDARSDGAPASASVIAGDGSLQPPAGVFAPDAFIRIDPDGTIALVISKVEMGQGVYTAIPMLIAEELAVPLDRVKVEHAPPDARLYADPLLGQQATGGSLSIRATWEPMRRAGAAARMLLVNAAAQQWQVDAAACVARDAVITDTASGRTLGYGECASRAAGLPVSADLLKTVTLKKPQTFTLIGTAHKRLDSPEKVNGVARFGIDVREPGMLVAMVVNCPVIGGKLAKVDGRVALAQPGVRQIVKLDNAVAVVADHTWAAKRGASALVIDWDEGANANLTTAMLFDDLRRASQRPGAIARKDGDVDAAFKGAAKNMDAVYQQPFLAHATMEPMNCTVHVTGDRCEVWIGTQVPTRVVDEAVKVTGLPPDRIVVHNFLIGGGFGRRLESDVARQAVAIGKQVDAPVKVMWSREEDIQHDMFRPCYLDSIAAGLDSNGKPVAWTHRIAGSSIVARWYPEWFKNGIDPDVIEVAATLPYDVQAQRIDYVRQEPRGIPTAFWRGVGPTRGTFVVESFVDELAHESKTDPVEYRRALLGKTPRARNVLDVAARAAGWGTGMPKGKGRGVSVMNAFGSFLCVVAEVDVKDGEVRVERIVCVVDCGHVVNPNTIEAQIEGGAIFGITATLWGEITLKDGRVEQTNFTDYRVMRIDEAPRIETIIVKSEEAPGGIGEPGTSAVIPAVTNAIFAATGTRVRRLPVGDQLRSGQTA
ncbi:xanthine dehydrogenase family protein molybdopterin-binding subunit [Paraburkholderia sp. SARCC-3016]|uniref:xanthine dehydrogenase family protein molybdopterin-binding subunit n=1 Tax=Paraburkholderia sp. SARCC-3016 TaxID=3058611 RepID=UPI002809444F|nr:xanthine dehydrogenase family protein molybdopterin-binding subunit [Paraburkholderia sp. SARCC-3016]MDQ7976170.1 xanthine dehydrogenase family protein molybdopterin-binding subunit [Paraburkholderia sp. SARCC-3016]